MINCLCIFGDGYTNEIIQPFTDYLYRKGISVLVVPLREENDTCSYEELQTDNYCDYIDSYVEGTNKKAEKWVGYGISKGAHWIRVYASKRPNLFSHIVLVEETTMNPKNMVKFENDRGNDFVEQYDRMNTELPGLESREKALNVIVNDDNKYIPKCPIVQIWTTRNNENVPYDETVLRAKKDFTNYLKKNGAKVKTKTINSEHCVDTKEQFFPLLYSAISQSS